MPHAAARIFNIVFASRDQVHMRMENGLARRFAVVDAQIESVNGLVLFQQSGGKFLCQLMNREPLIFRQFAK